MNSRDYHGGERFTASSGPASTWRLCILMKWEITLHGREWNMNLQLKVLFYRPKAL